MSNVDSKPNVIIIGAGIAGLSAAKRLSSQFDCMILEASDRVGGRIYTDYWQETPIELGAVAVQGAENNPIMAMAQQIHLAMGKIDNDSTWLKDEQGEIVDLDQMQKYDEIYYNLCEKAVSFANVSLSEGIQKALPTEPTIPASFIHGKNRMMSGYFGMDFTELSAQFYAQEKVLPGGNYAVTGGYEKIINFLNPENLDIKLNSKVTEINYINKNSIKITVNNNQIFECEKIIITVPLGVLKKQEINFTPQLPLEKKLAITDMDMGILNKIILFFDDCFWPKDIQKLICLHPDVTVPIFLNYHAFTNRPVLAGFIGGSAGKKLENLSDDEIVSHCCEDLKRMFNQEIPKPSKVFITRWSKEPGYYGSYSCLRKGVDANMYDVLAEPIDNRLFFAGEATMKDFPGTVHGAYFSGVLAARKIMKQFGLTPEYPDELEQVYLHPETLKKVKI